MNAQSPTLLTQKRVRLLGAVLALLLFAELALQLSLRQGWSAHKGLDAVKAVAVDRQGQVWAAGYRGGVPSLMIYPENGNFSEIPLPHQLARDAPSALMIDRQDRVWVGSNQGIVGMRDVNNEWILYTSDPDYSIWEIVMDGQGQVWARSHRGPGRIDPDAGDKTFTFTGSGLADNDAVAIATDKKGQLWALTLKREIKVLEPDGNWRTFTTAPEIVRNSIFGSMLAFDPQGQMWLATSNGVGVLSPGGAWTAYPLGDPGRPLSIKAILPDANGRVWVAADVQGLFMFDPKTGWRSYTSRNSGLRSDVSALALDDRGQVWIGSSQRGLSKFDPDMTLPVQTLSTVLTAAELILPVTLLSIALLAVLALAFARPGAASRKTVVGFCVAFAGWFIINSFLWAYISFSQAQSAGLLFISPLVLIPLPVNVLALVLLYRTNRWMALGALAAFLVNWIGLVFISAVADASGLPPLYGAIFMIPFYLPFLPAI